MEINSDVAQSKKGNIGNKKLVVLFFIIGILAFLFFIAKAFMGSKNNTEDLINDKEVALTANEKTFKVEDLDTKEKNFNFNDKPPVQNNIPFIGVDAPITVPQAMSPRPSFSKSAKGALVVSNDSKNNSFTKDKGSFVNDDSEPFINGNKDMFASQVENFEAEVAYTNPLNPNFMIEQGTYIPCVLRQKLISNVGGQISCTISSNVLSKNGKVVLLDKGTTIIGIYKSGAVSRGANEIGVIWQQARTPDNLIVNLNSGSTDELGANGLSGWTDQHFWDRFGNAIIVSLITDASSAVTTQLQKTNSNNYLQNTQDRSSDLAKSIIEQQSDIRPTLYKNQGDKVGIFVARDIDFSKVYELKIKRQ